MVKKMKRSLLRTKLAVKTTLSLQSLGVHVGPTALYKVEKILAAQRFFNLKTFVETGTYLGTTLSAVATAFEKLYSIELSTELAREAQQHFASTKKISVIAGDSGNCIQKIVSEDTDPKLFWLDAHYSGGLTAVSQDFGHTPISKELTEIFKAWIPGSVILIDDARLFNGTDNYPTLDQLKKYIYEQEHNLALFIDHDIIHIY